MLLGSLAIQTDDRPLGLALAITEDLEEKPQVCPPPGNQQAAGISVSPYRPDLETHLERFSPWEGDLPGPGPQ